VKHAIATIQLIPIGTSFTVIKSTALDEANGFYG